jgi:glutathione S-transferase
MMKLCGVFLSNYFNKVRLALLEKEIPHELDTAAYPSQNPEYLQRSPMGKVPFLETDQGTLVESQIICEYLEERYPEKPLYPADPFERARVRELIQVLELHMELVARRVIGAALFGAPVSDETKKEVARDLEKGLRAFTHLAKFGPYLAGKEFTLADVAAAMHMTTISVITKAVLGADALAGIPQLPDYFKLLRERPSVQKVEADRNAAFAAFMSSKQQS